MALGVQILSSEVKKPKKTTRKGSMDCISMRKSLLERKVFVYCVMYKSGFCGELRVRSWGLERVVLGLLGLFVHEPIFVQEALGGRSVRRHRRLKKWF